MLPATLDAIQELLESEELSCKRQSVPSQEVGLPDSKAQEELLIELPADDTERAYTLRLAFLEKDLQLKDSANKEVKKERFLQLLLVLPFKIKEEALNPLARYLLLINQSLEFPGFGLDENKGIAYYRHILFFPANRVSNRMLLDLVGIVLLLVDVFGSPIEKIANLDQTLLELNQNE